MDSALHPVDTACQRPPVPGSRFPLADASASSRGSTRSSTVAGTIQKHVVERFWLGTSGPTAAWLMRRLAAGFDDHPGGYDLDLHATAHRSG